jgi:hypothetical protein
MKTIDAKFIHNEKKDHQATGEANGQSKDVDEREYLIFNQVSPGGNPIIFKHIG